MLLVVSYAQAAVRDDPDDSLPAVGRPEDFNGAIGSFAEVSQIAEPTTVQAEDPITLRLRIRADGPVQQPPQRPPLGKLSSFASRFLVEDSGAKRPDEHTWEFVYRLRPRSATVQEIPTFHFSYFRPGFGYQDRYTEPVELHVRPRPEVKVTDIDHSSTPFPPLDGAAHLVEGAVVLRHEEPWAPPSLPILGLLLAAPPLACLCWSLVWRQLYPDAARQARRRRSRAGRLALQELTRAARETSSAHAEGAVRIVSRYLRDRLSLPTAEPTPMETATYLKQAGCSSTLVDRAGSFYHLCDRARFAPDAETRPVEVTNAAVQLVLAVEEES
jgi:hypothetical protein